MFIQVNTEYQGEKNTIWLNTDHIAYIDGHMLQMSNTFTVFPDDESLKKILEVVTPKDRQVKNNTPDKEMLELFEKLHKLTGGKGKPVFSLQREKKLRDLLGKHRMTEEDLIKAATNIGKDDFLQGRDPNNESKKRYGDVDYLLRPDKAAKWAEDQTEKKKSMF